MRILITIDRAVVSNSTENTILTANVFIYSALQLQVCLINSVQFSSVWHWAGH